VDSIYFDLDEIQDTCGTEVVGSERQNSAANVMCKSLRQGLRGKMGGRD
jgi:hypothetical protein